MVFPHVLTNRSSESADSPPRVGAVARLRRALFAQAASEAATYGIGFDRVLEHLWQVRGRSKRFRLRGVQHPGDLVHAIACIDDVGTAWHDLAERHEAALVRVGHSVSADGEAVVLARRLLADLRRLGKDGANTDLISLRDYHGEVPLRRWLNHRLVARIHLASRSLPRRLNSRSNPQSSPQSGRLRLALPHDQVPPAEHNRANVETACINARSLEFTPCVGRRTS